MVEALTTGLELMGPDGPAPVDTNIPLDEESRVTVTLRVSDGSDSDVICKVTATTQECELTEFSEMLPTGGI